jgi:AcrR family transcriptional regulator
MLNKICLVTEKLFVRYGIRSVTMDVVAKELGISKKTLYQYVADKDDLVNKTIIFHLDAIDHIITTVMLKETNAIQQILNIAELMIGMHRDICPGLLFDLKKFHPETFKLLTEHREKAMFTQLSLNLQTGINQGLYRENISIDLTVGFYMTLIHSCVDSEISCVTHVPFHEKYPAMINYHFNSICTEEGLNFLHKNKNILTNPILQ